MENKQNREDWNLEDLEQALQISIILCRAHPAFGSWETLSQVTE